MPDDAQDSAEPTRLLTQARQGNTLSAEALFPLVYDELRRIARRQLDRAPDVQTLSTTGLVHEAYLRLIDQTQASWQDRAHFLGIAARSMRQIVVDYARRRRRDKRGGGQRPVTINDDLQGRDPTFELILGVDHALEQLGRYDARLVQVVECRFFGAMTNEETAQALGVSPRTAERLWTKARAYLAYLLQQPDTDSA